MTRIREEEDWVVTAKCCINVFQRLEEPSVHSFLTIKKRRCVIRTGPLQYPTKLSAMARIMKIHTHSYYRTLIGSYLIYRTASLPMTFNDLQILLQLLETSPESISRQTVFSMYQADSQPKSSGLVLGRRPLGAILHSSNEPGELSQWLCHDDSTINIVGLIIIIIIIIISVKLITKITVAFQLNYCSRSFSVA